LKLGQRSNPVRAALPCLILKCKATRMAAARRSWHPTATEGDEAPSRARKIVAHGAHRCWTTTTPLATMAATASHRWSLAVALQSAHPADRLPWRGALATSTLCRCSGWTLRQSPEMAALQQLRRSRQ
jgi:hypothetical protein